MCEMNNGNFPKILKILRIPFSLLVPDVCPICGNPLDDDLPICHNCSQKLQNVRTPLSHFAVDELFFDDVFAPYRYDGIAKDVVHLFKYQSVMNLGRFMAQEIYKILDSSFDFIVWVPLHKARRRERGFSQTEKLAKWLTQMSGVPSIRALVRTRYTKPQVSMDNHKKRMFNVRHAFELVRSTQIETLKGKKLLLVDDVMTTGATMNEAARPLKKLGCNVSAAVFAITD